MDPTSTILAVLGSSILVWLAAAIAHDRIAGSRQKTIVAPDKNWNRMNVEVDAGPVGRKGAEMPQNPHP